MDQGPVTPARTAPASRPSLGMTGPGRAAIGSAAARRPAQADSVSVTLRGNAAAGPTLIRLPVAAGSMPGKPGRPPAAAAAAGGSASLSATPQARAQ